MQLDNVVSISVLIGLIIAETVVGASCSFEMNQLLSVTACLNEYEDQDRAGVMIPFKAIHAAIAASGSRLRVHFPMILP